MNQLLQLWQTTGLASMELGQLVMISICLLLIFLAIKKGFEPLLLIPIGFGGILANVPLAGMANSAIDQAMQFGTPEVKAEIAMLLDGAQLYTLPQSVQETLHQIAVTAGFNDGILYLVYSVGLTTGFFPLFIFMGVGAMTDFGPMLANPKTLFLGAAAQFGIFGAFLGAIGLSQLGIGLDFTMNEAASIGIIGGADGPTAIYLTTKLAPHLLGPIAVAAYSYMALVPLIQPPIVRALTTVDERNIKMRQLRHVSQLEKILLPLILVILVSLLIPDAAPLLGMFCFGNLMRESKVVGRLTDTTQNALINVLTIGLGLAVGAKLKADAFLQVETLGILVIGILAFALGTACGVLMAKVMNKYTKEPINPIIGGAGVSAVPMAARVANKLGLEANPHNFLLMHAMGPNVAGVIGSAVAAGVLLSLVGG